MEVMPFIKPYSKFFTIILFDKLFQTKQTKTMYGLIGSITTTQGQRDAFIEILLEGIADMPGCLSYIVAKDSEDENKIWITEVWDSKGSHKASLSLPMVQEAIAKGRSMIAGFGEQTETEPVGGHGYNDSSTSG